MGRANNERVTFRISVRVRIDSQANVRQFNAIALAELRKGSRPKAFAIQKYPGLRWHRMSGPDNDATQLLTGNACLG